MRKINWNSLLPFSMSTSFLSLCRGAQCAVSMRKCLTHSPSCIVGSPALNDVQSETNLSYFALQMALPTLKLIAALNKFLRTFWCKYFLRRIVFLAATGRKKGRFSSEPLKLRKYEKFAWRVVIHGPGGSRGRVGAPGGRVVIRWLPLAHEWPPARQIFHTSAISMVPIKNVSSFALLLPEKNTSVENIYIKRFLET